MKNKVIEKNYIDLDISSVNIMSELEIIEDIITDLYHNNPSYFKQNISDDEIKRLITFLHIINVEFVDDLYNQIKQLINISYDFIINQKKYPELIEKLKIYFTNIDVKDDNYVSFKNKTYWHDNEIILQFYDYDKKPKLYFNYFILNRISREFNINKKIILNIIKKMIGDNFGDVEITDQNAGMYFISKLI